MISGIGRSADYSAHSWASLSSPERSTTRIARPALPARGIDPRGMAQPRARQASAAPGVTPEAGPKVPERYPRTSGLDRARPFAVAGMTVAPRPRQAQEHCRETSHSLGCAAVRKATRRSRPTQTISKRRSTATTTPPSQCLPFWSWRLWLPLGLSRGLAGNRACRTAACLDTTASEARELATG